MLLEISTAAGKVGAILATIIYALTLLGQVDKVIINHLADAFASKEDVQSIHYEVDRMDQKLDAVLNAIELPIQERRHVLRHGDNSHATR